MPNFVLTISADTLPQIEGEQLRATVTNLRTGEVARLFGTPDAGKFDAEYFADYGDELSITRAWVLGPMEGPETEASLVTLPFPKLPMPTGGGISASLP